MNHPLAARYFSQPQDPHQRRYEALRAVFVEGRKIKQVAQQFQLPYGSLRNLVSQFQRQLQQEPPVPFFRLAAHPSRFAKARHKSPLPRSPKSPIAAVLA